MPKFAIVGGGFTGLTTLAQFLNAIETDVEKDRKQQKQMQQPIEVVLFEQQAEIGPGTVYETGNDCHLLNTTPDKMAVDPKDPDAFTDWVCEEKNFNRIHNKIIQDGHTEIAQYLSDLKEKKQLTQAFFPRYVYGWFLKEHALPVLLKKAIQLSVTVTLKNEHEVVDCEETNNHVTVTAKNLNTQETCKNRFKHVFSTTGYGTGHQHSTQQRFKENAWTLTSPYPAAKVNALAKNKSLNTILVLGTSLTSFDAVFSIAAQRGKFTPAEGEYAPPGSLGKLTYTLNEPFNGTTITLASRRGVVPKTRDLEAKPQVLKHFTPQAFPQAFKDDAFAKQPTSYTDRAINLFLKDVNSEGDSKYTIDEAKQWFVNPPPTTHESLKQDLTNAQTGSKWEPLFLGAIPGILCVQHYLNTPGHEPELAEFYQQFSLLFTYLVPAPPIAIQKILALMEAKVLTILKLGKNYQLEYLKKGYRLSTQEEKLSESDERYDAMVVCTGGDAHIPQQPLYNALWKKGAIQPILAVEHPHVGAPPVTSHIGVKTNPDTFQPTKKDGTASSRISVVSAALINPQELCSAAFRLVELTSRAIQSVVNNDRLHEASPAEIEQKEIKASPAASSSASINRNCCLFPSSRHYKELDQKKKPAMCALI